MSAAARQIRRCTRCGRRIGAGSGMTLCEVCTYADEVSRDAAERQVKLADAARHSEAQQRKTVKP